MKRAQIHCGYLPLVDCAPLIIAKELCFAAEEGLDLHLIQQPSWSALRDRLAFGQIDFAHMLSPMSVAMSLGLSGVATRIDALMVLSVNGTVIGISADLDRRLQAIGWRNTFTTPQETSTALFEVTSTPLRIGVPFPFSMHRMLLETWLSQAPSYAAERIKIVTVPPSKMAEAVRDGSLDMFCVGEPWGTVAVQQSNATLILPGSRIWALAPEKVLAVRHEWAEQNNTICEAMIRSLSKATNWLDQPQNTPLAVSILARSQHLDLPEQAIDPALTHRLTCKVGESPRLTEQFLRFYQNAANFPWHSQASWIAGFLSGWHGLNPKETRQIACACFRTDLYRSALAPMGVELPRTSEKIEGAMISPTPAPSTQGEMILGPDGFFSGVTFDFDTLDAPKNQANAASQKKFTNRATFFLDPCRPDRQYHHRATMPYQANNAASH